MSSEPTPEGTTTSGTMHFSIDGDWLCSLIRDTILSDLPDKAEKILGEIEGLTREQFVGILRGDLTLNSELTDIGPLDEKRKSAYTSQLAYLLAGRIRLPNRAGWWRPCAAITSLGPEDMRGRAREISNGIAMGRNARRGEITFGSTADVDPREFKTELTALWTVRGQHYAHSGEVAVPVQRRVFFKEGRGLSFIVIFEPCEAPPSWWEGPLDATAAVESALKANRIFDRRGNAMMYGKEEDDDFIADDSRPMDKRMLDTAVDARNALEAKNERKDRAESDAAKWVQHEVMRKRQIVELRQEIFNAAGADLRRLGYGDWYRVTAEDGRVYTVLRKPFDLYVMQQKARYFDQGAAQAVLDSPQGPKWTPISPMGLKLMNDTPAHSDVILTLQVGRTIDGTEGHFWESLFEFDPNEWYAKQSSREPIDMAWRAALYDLQNAVEEFYMAGGDARVLAPQHLLDFDAKAHREEKYNKVITLDNKGRVLLAPPGVSVIEGIIVCPEPNQEVPKGTICVVSHLGPDYYIPAASTGGGGLIIADAGGETAHLVTVGRDAEDFPTLLVLPGATTRLTAGMKVRVDASTGIVELL